MKGLVAKQPGWHAVTASEPKPDPDPRSKPIDFSLTKAERDIATNAMVDVLAMQRRAKFAQPSTRGLEAGELTLADLTSAELIALSGGDQ